MEYVRRKPNFPFTVLGFTNRKKLLAYLGVNPDEEVPVESAKKKDEIPEVILVESLDWETWLEEEREEVEHLSCCLCFLDERKRTEAEDFHLYKYQSVDGLLRGVLACYETDERNDLTETGQTRFVGVYSPDSGDSRSVCALALGNFLADKEDVLVLNLEALPDWPVSCSNSSYGLSDLLYFRKNAEKRFYSLTDHVDQVAILPPVVNPEDIWNSSSMEMREMLEEMGKYGTYQTIIVELGPEKDPIPVLQLCQRIVIPHGEKMSSRRKTKKMLDYLEFRGETSIRDSCREWIFPEDFDLEFWETRNSRGEMPSVIREYVEKEWNSWEKIEMKV
ncbi:MAG: hypothetical protein PUB22_04385 [Clostridiales bacterium]|nr:hypothetical protein [Clostridiales bacterium]